MKQLRPPEPLVFDTDKPRLFLAGSIEMGKAVDWQTEVTEALRDLDIVVLNPRREAWDSSWQQNADFPPFREQVEWELDALEVADLILFYFAPETKSPITLLELGMHLRRNVVVCCPEGYWRKGNVDVVCRRYRILQVPTLLELVERVREKLVARQNV